MRRFGIKSVILSLMGVVVIIYHFITTFRPFVMPEFYYVDDYGMLTLCIVLGVVIPLLLIVGAVFAAKKDLVWMSGVILSISILYIPVWMIVNLSSTTICSYTTEVSEYGNYDEYVAQRMNYDEFYDDMSELEGTEVTSYIYKYKPTDYSYLVAVELSFEDEAAYEAELERLSQYIQKREEGYTYLFEDDLRVGTVKVNDAVQTITYLYSNEGIGRWSDELVALES